MFQMFVLKYIWLVYFSQKAMFRNFQIYFIHRRKWYTWNSDIFAHTKFQIQFKGHTNSSLSR